MNLPDPRSLKHHPVVLLHYENHDGPYAGDTDCQYITIGWAQYDPRELSVKTLRHTGERWSRQSEELPIHRCLDATMLIAATIAQINDATDEITLEAGVLEKQDSPLHIPIETRNAIDHNNFKHKLNDPLLLRRLSKLANILMPFAQPPSNNSGQHG